ncbi:BlaI family transcriptional regulator, penicillinase repressor [Clostridium cavendishii DSM 21758]|uniref:BlaI family transcriptional regulator, penicillinase repressor n=1 Tax=Clostridium cavendishii DSM 21758 TaxID=1121302 RepID=A0A1M6J4L4_9CLOT|nr:BlaI/MecI/CopY family transcriptional regulator [Clostridium cavendishii]SHJ41577.1 BlaI family transcriptional regulator, penicillinase repressor [Clostridium cavendishii DSM 21758]
MKNYPSISDAEWIVIDVLWSRNPLTSTEIIEEVSKTNDWNPKTVHTLISRLVKKQAITAEKVGNFYSYYPNYTKEELSNYETKSFLQKIYNGSINMLLSNFLKEEKLNSKEIDELKQILKEKKE